MSEDTYDGYFFNGPFYGACLFFEGYQFGVIPGTSVDPIVTTRTFFVPVFRHRLPTP